MCIFFDDVTLFPKLSLKSTVNFGRGCVLFVKPEFEIECRHASLPYARLRESRLWFELPYTV